MDGPGKSLGSGRLGSLLHPGGRFLSRLGRVIRFDLEVFAEIEQDPHAIPQAFAVVIGTAVVGSLAQGFPGIFLGIVGAILVWGAGTCLVWAIGGLVTAELSPFPVLLRCLGFAYAWFALLIAAGLPLVGSLFGWSAVVLCLASAVGATRQTLRATTGQALAICAASFGAPVLILRLLS